MILREQQQKKNAETNKCYNIAKIILMKKMHNVRIESCFIWEKNEDSSPGDSTSDRSERPLQRDSGEGQYIRF